MSPLAVLGIDVPNPVNLVLDPIKDAAMAPVNMLANAIADALQGMVKTLSTAWIRIDTPNLATDDGRASTTVGFLQGQLVYLVGFCAVMALILGGARLAWEGRHEPARDVLRGLLTLAVVSGCGLAVIGLLVTASDQLAEHIIDVSTDGNGFGKNLETLLAVNATLAPFMVIFLGVIALLVSLVQVVLIVFRAAALVMLAGFLPLAASFTSTPAGRQHFKRFTGWTIAVVAYKPVAALCYAAAFRLVGSREFNADGVLSVLVGLALMTLAIVALPALLKFLVPAVQAINLGGGGGGHVLMSAAVALPAGARVVHMAGAGGGYAAARGMSGPSGASSPGPSGGSGAPGTSGAPGGPGRGTNGGQGSPGSAGPGGSPGAPGSPAPPAGGSPAAATGASPAHGGRGPGSSAPPDSGAAAAPGAAASDASRAIDPRTLDGQDGPHGSQRRD